MSPFSPRSTRLYSRPWRRSWRRSFEHIIGESVSAVNPDTSTAPASVSANSMKSFPVRPVMNAIGAYTAASVRVIATTAKPISRDPTSAAWNGAIPSSTWR